MKRNGELRKVLVIDDDDDLADVVRQVLRDAGYSVATVRHGAAALELTKHVAPDLILVDLSMPIMDGWSFVQQYRRVAGVPARVVVMSAAGDLAHIASQLGADGHLKKPFDLNQLHALVAAELAKRPSARNELDRTDRSSSAPLT